MNNKILVKIISPQFNKSYDVFIPTNEYVYIVIELVIKIIKGLNESEQIPERDYMIINKNTGQVYDYKMIVRDTDIRNSTELFLI